jgi:hypothetical protein
MILSDISQCYEENCNREEGWKMIGETSFQIVDKGDFSE